MTERKSFRSSNIGQKTAYYLAESNFGPEGCGALCHHCYLAYGGEKVSITQPPPVEKIIKDVQLLQEQGWKVILTGADLLTRLDLWDAGLLNDKEYLLTNGVLISNFPDLYLPLLKNHRIRAVDCSLACLPSQDNLFNCAPPEKTIQAIKLLKSYRQREVFEFNIGVNITVGTHNLGSLSDMVGFALDKLGCDGIRFNRLKALSQRFQPYMLTHNQLPFFYQQIEGLRRRYPFEITGKPISVSGDFGSVARKKPYVCPAGSKLITVVPREDGTAVIYPCLEVRTPELEIGQVVNGSIELNTALFDQLYDPNHSFPFSEGGCLAYMLTSPDYPPNLLEKLRETL